jgi:hypothetical protein
MKIHKSPMKTRPILSLKGSLIHGIGLWSNDKLQQYATRQKAYFKSSFDLKTELVTMDVPPGAHLFIADAVSMYTNIHTDRALQFVSQHIREHVSQFANVPAEALIEALEIIMTLNIFTFGDTTWIQDRGTAMDSPPPRPPQANLYYALKELDLLPKFEDNLALYTRFIDNVLGLWLPTDPATDAERWEEFIAQMNCPVFGLEWVVSPQSMEVDNMDLNIKIQDNKIVTSLFEKASNHHLYIPPHSSYPPGLLLGMVHGMLYHIHTLCTNDKDKRCWTIQFLRHLQVRGYSPTTLRPLLSEAITRATSHVTNLPMPRDNNDEMRKSMIFHIRYHPKNTPLSALQHAWHTHVATPPTTHPLREVTNHNGTECNLERMIIAHNLPFNLGNLLSYRKLKPKSGPPVSSYL